MDYARNEHPAAGPTVAAEGAAPPRGSVIWDQGAEMAAHRSFTVATDMPDYFGDRDSPWQRGSN